MYNLVSAIGKSKQYNGRWSAIDISTIPMVQIYNDYSKVIATITSSFAPTVKLSLDLDEVKSVNISSSVAFNDFLINNGNTTLPTSTVLYELSTKYCIYSDAIRARYKIMAVAEDGNINSNIPIPDRDWLSLKKPNINYTLFQKSCLVSVNGLIHLTDTDGNQVLVRDGAKSARISKLNQVGITSFRELGELELMPITTSMIHRRYPDIPLNRNMYIDIGPAKPNKTAMLVLGGYLHVLDNTTFHRISDSIFAINFENFPLLERYFESKQFIDLSSLGLDASVQYNAAINMPELLTDDVLIKYATLSQSFLVFINTENMFVENAALKRSNLSGKFTSHIEPIYPLIVGCGLIADYWRVKEDKQWALSMNVNWQNNYLFNTTPLQNLNNVNDARTPENLLDLGRGHFLKIGSDIRKIVGE